VRRLLVTASVVPSSPILVTLVKVALSTKRRFLQEPHGVKSQKSPFFIVTAVKTSNLTYPLRYLRVPPTVRVPQVEDHWSIT
jgi:hypothetical protein